MLCRCSGIFDSLKKLFLPNLPPQIHLHNTHFLLIQFHSMTDSHLQAKVLNFHFIKDVSDFKLLDLNIAQLSADSEVNKNSMSLVSTVIHTDRIYKFALNLIYKKYLM